MNSGLNPASGFGPGGSVWVLLAPTVWGSLLTAWRLAGAAWAKVQVINVPIEYGSSS
ncbi:MAG TPA: hypothetical protein VGY96_14090 [Streptosporangiaceae bacterium]|jgi:hypothetical protein|nr:hypothetical protein [Streptosporangiaceae bacterium]